MHSRTFPYLATLVAFAAIVIMMGLGFWQLERKDEKELRIAQIENARLQESITLSTILQDPESFEDYSASVSGKLINAPFYIDNKLNEGKGGFHVLLPLQTNAGIVMLNMGWLAAKRDTNRLDLPEHTLPLPSEQNIDSMIEVSGIVYLPTLNRLVKETNTEYGDFPAVLQQVDLAEMSKHLKQDVLPFVLRLNQNDNTVYVRDWQVITMSPEKHLGYAIQWFGLAIAALTVYLLSAVKRLKGPHAKNND